jgi:Carbohydrate-binding family 9
MRKLRISYFTVFIFGIFLFSCTSKGPENSYPGAYLVKKLHAPFCIDANWDKSVWQDADVLSIGNTMGDLPGFIPDTRARIMYDDSHLYVIFRVADRYVKAINTKPNGPVWEDSCVELFFAPDSGRVLEYFNLEVNCGGTPLMRYTRTPRKDYNTLTEKELSSIEIAASMPAVVYPELVEDTVWTLAYKIPFDLLKHYSAISQPEPGVVWKANLYKIADKTSNPHYLTWTPVEHSKPDFHRPEFFGDLVFE